MCNMIREDRVVIRQRTAKDRGGRRTTMRRRRGWVLGAAGWCWLHSQEITLLARSGSLNRILDAKMTPRCWRTHSIKNAQTTTNLEKRKILKMNLIDNFPKLFVYFSTAAFLFIWDAKIQQLMKLTIQQHIRTILGLPKNRKNIGGQHDDSFCPGYWFTPIWVPGILRAGSVCLPCGAEDQPCRAKVTERTRRRPSGISQNVYW